MKNDFWNHVHFGRCLGLEITNSGFNRFISPSTIYQLNKRFATEIGLNFNSLTFEDYSLFTNQPIYSFRLNSNNYESIGAFRSTTPIQNTIIGRPPFL
ncbi:MAG: hypothetical protein QM485_00930 [Flavobacteriaceae bacterium]